MTTVTLNGLNAALGAAEPIKNGTVEATYWAGGAAATRVTGANVVLPATMRSAIVAGAPSAALVVDATDGTFCVRWRVQSRGHVYERFTSIPASGTVAFGDLTVVDPDTFAALDPVPPTAQQVLAESEAALGAAAAAEAAKVDAEAAAASVIPSTDAAMATVAADPESAFALQQSATIGGEIEAQAADSESPMRVELSGAYASTSLFDRKRTPRPPMTVVAPLVAGHAWTASAASSTNNANDTTDWASGDRCITVITNGNATTAVRVQITGQNFDLTGKGLMLLFKLDSNRVQLQQFYLDVGDNTFANRYRLAMTLPSGGKSVLWADEWVPVWVTFADLAKGTITGTPTRAGLTALRLYWADSGAPIAVKFGGVAKYTEGIGRYPSGVTSFTMDDTVKDQIKAAEYISRFGGTVTFFPIIGRLGLSGSYYTEADLRKAVFSYGSELGFHAMDDAGHIDQTGRPQADVEADFRAGRQWAFDHGFPPMVSYAFPIGPFDKNAVDSVRRYFGYGRTNDTRVMSPTSDHRYSASAIVLGSSTTLAAAKAAVDSAKADGLWVNFVMHDIPTSSPTSNGWLWSDFIALVDYIVAQGVPMLAAGDVINAL